MCMRSMPYGIPIEEETHEQFPQEVKDAWEDFHEWWVRNFDGYHPIKWSDVPAKIKADFDIMCAAKIPGYDGATGKDSCYVIGVNANTVD